MANIVNTENRSYELKLEGPVIKIGGGSDIPDINTIRNNAQLGANAYNTISTYGDIVTHNADEFATAAQGALASTALQAGDDVSKLINDAGYISSADLSHYATKADLTAGLSDKQDRLVSGTNIKTINGIPLVGSGNITVGGSVSSVNSKTGAVVLTAADVDALPDTTKYGYAIDLEFDHSDDKLTVTLKDQDGAVLSSEHVDFALESVVVGAAYDSAGKKIVLTLKNGDTVDVPVGDLVDGLQAEITSTQKLNADLVDDSTSVNKFTTAAEKATWNGKQDAITDLATIRAGATAGSTALQAGDNVSDLTNDAGYVTSTDLSNYTTQTYVDTELDKKQDKLVSGTSLKTINNNSLLGSGNINIEYTEGTGIDITNNVISVDNTIALKSEIPTNNNQLTNGAGYITGINSSDVTTALGYTPYDSTNPDGYITSDALDPYTPTSGLATVATSGSYTDLINKPTIPVVNDATLTIKQGGVTKGTFSANASTNETIELDSGGSTYTAGNGISISGTTISVADPTLVNTATGTNALSTGTAVATGARSLALGHQAIATAAGAIQLGKGTNSTEKTLQVSFNTGTSTGEDYTLLGSDGIIPVDRLATPVTEEGIYILKTFLDWEGNQTTYWAEPDDEALPITCYDTYTGVGYGSTRSEEDAPEHTVFIATSSSDNNVEPEATHGVYIGGGNSATYPYGIGIGWGAAVGNTGAIQLGNGQNINAGTFQVSLTTDGQTYNHYQVLDSNGIIPRARLGNTSSAAFIEGDYVLIANGSDKSWKAVPTVDQTYSSTSTNAQSGKAVASAITNKADKATTLAGYGITDGANTNLSNLTAAGKSVVANLPMPGGTKVTLTLGASGVRYTAPEDGWFYISISSTGVQGVTYVSLYNVTRGFGEKSDMYRHTIDVVLVQRCVIPVTKGDVVAIAYDMGNTMSETTCKFMYTNATS